MDKRKETELRRIADRRCTEARTRAAIEEIIARRQFEADIEASGIVGFEIQWAIKHGYWIG